MGPSIQAAIMSRKAVRKARKQVAVTLSLTPEHGISIKQHASPQECEEIQYTSAEDSVQYECCVCGDDLPLADGVVPCEEHFICDVCVVDAFDVAIKDMELFPAQCCKPLPRRLVEHLLSTEVIEAYKAKAKEHYTSRVLRVYCVNDNCRRFIPDQKFDNHHAWYTVAHCECGTTTCVGCKAEWTDDHHRCLDSNEPGVKPEWLPEYSESCRIKQCPECRMWIEHQEACNHMTCCYCRHEFCFVCLLPWDGNFHDSDGCPSYKDPPAGYDEDGFERSARGLHRDTGFDRNGLDRLGRHKFGYVPEDGEYNEYDNDDRSDFGGDYADDEHHDDEGDGYDDWEEMDEEVVEEPNRDVDDDGFQEVANDQMQNGDAINHVFDVNDMPWPAEVTNDGWHVAVHQNEVALPVDPEVAEQHVPQPAATAHAIAHDHASAAGGSNQEATTGLPQQVVARARPTAPSDHDRERIRRAWRCPIFAVRPDSSHHTYNGGLPTLLQLEDNHVFRYSSFYPIDYDYAYCSICHFGMPLFFYYCRSCGIVVCRFCSENFDYYCDRYRPGARDLLPVITWAEQGIVPFRAGLKIDLQQRQAELDGDWGIKSMIEAYDEELYQLQPFMYWDYGIRGVFGEAEQELRKRYWIVTEENVGLLGPDFQMTFRLDTNPYAPLFWDEDSEA